MCGSGFRKPAVPKPWQVQYAEGAYITDVSKLYIRWKAEKGADEKRKFVLSDETHGSDTFRIDISATYFWSTIH